MPRHIFILLSMLLISATALALPEGRKVRGTTYMSAALSTLFPSGIYGYEPLPGRPITQSEVYEGGGSDGGEEDLVNGLSQITFTHRPLTNTALETASRNGLKIEGSLLGQSPVNIVVNKKNKTVSLTEKNISDIFSCRVRNWSENSGSELNGEIQVLARRKQDSRTTEVVSTYLNEPFGACAKYVSDKVQMIETVEADENAIGFTDEETLNKGWLASCKSWVPLFSSCSFARHLGFFKIHTPDKARAVEIDGAPLTAKIFVYFSSLETGNHSERTLRDLFSNPENRKQFVKEFLPDFK